MGKYCQTGWIFSSSELENIFGKALVYILLILLQICFELKMMCSNLRTAGGNLCKYLK